MIKVVKYINNEGIIVGFKSNGHSEYSTLGNDIVCAGISTAVFGAYYYIKWDTNAQITFEVDEPMLKVLLKKPNHDAQVALSMMFHQVQMIKDSHAEQIEIFTKEV